MNNYDVSKSFSQAAENNKKPISEVLKHYLNKEDNILEIGSGTGQHVDYFSKIFPEVIWQPTDVAEKSGMNLLDKVEVSNVLPYLQLNVSNTTHWPKTKFDLVYTSNTLHIMAWKDVLSMLELATHVLKSNGLFICYGPFKFGGEFTTESNYNFDLSLKRRDAQMGLRNFEALQDEAGKNSLKFVKKYDMPANNHILIFRKTVIGE